MTTDSSGEPTPSLAEFNDMSPAQARRVLRACLDIPQWGTRLEAARPFPDLRALQAAGRRAASDITWDQAAGALARHPRIGEKKAATPIEGPESAWSAGEQGGVRAAHATALAEGNARYEARFGHIFLICAAGLTGEEILANLRLRLAHDETTERLVVIGELQKIAGLRLAKAVNP